MNFAAGTMIALGIWQDLGALLIVGFLVPTSLIMHAFWKFDDAQMRMNQEINFMKNASMTGAVLALFAFYATCSSDLGWYAVGPLF